MFSSSIPEISPKEMHQKLQSEETFLLLDVRELIELNQARLTDRRVEVTPMSQLARIGPNALPEAARDPAAEIIVICHHGARSAQVTAWLLSQGWKNVKSLAGGIDAYARQVDPTVGMY
jgi:rhodanese-related sulfurtransferase